MVLNEIQQRVGYYTCSIILLFYSHEMVKVNIIGGHSVRKNDLRYFMHNDSGVVVNK